MYNFVVHIVPAELFWENIKDRDLLMMMTKGARASAAMVLT